MPSIVGITEDVYKRLPMKVIHAERFRYTTFHGKLRFKDNNMVPLDNDLKTKDVDDIARFLLYNGWSPIYRNGVYVGYQAGVSTVLKNKYRESMCLDSQVKVLSPEELIKYKDNIFYDDTDLVAALDVMGCRNAYD